MKAVFDANVVVSACFWRGAPFECLAAWAGKRFQAAISPPLPAEYGETFAELLHDHGKRPHVDWVAPLRAGAEMVFPVDRATGATPDPFDEMVLEYDVAARADAIVSGDRKQFLPLGAYRGIPILGPFDFLTGINRPPNSCLISPRLKMQESEIFSAAL